MNSLAFSSCPIYKSYIRQANRKRNESTLLVWANVIRTIYLLGPEPRAALDHATPLYTALGDTVKKAVEFTPESITSLSNLVRSIQILISEQTPLMWKPGEKKFYKQISTIHNGSNITTGITCGRNGLMFLRVFKCFTTFPSTLKL